MYSIGYMTKRFAISRSTLLYYDSIGLLSPSGRSESNYRLYSDEDVGRMDKIALYRDAGLPLKSIAEVLEREGNQVCSILEEQLVAINGQMAELRNRQSAIIKMLGSGRLALNTRSMDKEQWVALLAATGLDEAAMARWHVEFEKMSPEAHQDFLESLGIESGEIKQIREFSKVGDV